MKHNISLELLYLLFKLIVHENASETLNGISVLQRSPNERFFIKVIKPEGVSMGMSVERASDGMLVSGFFCGGLIDLWNQKCQCRERLAEFDMIVAANGSHDFESMLDAVTGHGKIALEVALSSERSPLNCTLRRLRWKFSQ